MASLRQCNKAINILSSDEDGGGGRCRDSFTNTKWKVNDGLLTCMHTHTQRCIHVITGHLRYTLVVSSWTLFSLQSHLNTSQHWFIKVLGAVLRDSGSYWWHQADAANLSAAHPQWESPVSPRPKGPLLHCNKVTVEAIWVQWTHFSR